MNNTINDGSVLYGSVPITLTTGSAATYETDDFSLDHDIERFVRKSSLNLPDGKVVIKQEVTGSAVCKYPTSGTVAPVFGDAFTATLNGIAYAFHIEKVGIKRVMAGEAKVSITFSVDLGTVVVSAVAVV